MYTKERDILFLITAHSVNKIFFVYNSDLKKFSLPWTSKGMSTRQCKPGLRLKPNLRISLHTILSDSDQQDILVWVPGSHRMFDVCI